MTETVVSASVFTVVSETTEPVPTTPSPSTVMLPTPTSPSVVSTISGTTADGTTTEADSTTSLVMFAAASTLLTGTFVTLHRFPIYNISRLPH